jgi:hypothetical protein
MVRVSHSSFDRRGTIPDFGAALHRRWGGPVECGQAGWVGRLAGFDPMGSFP